MTRKNINAAAGVKIAAAMRAMAIPMIMTMGMLTINVIKQRVAGWAGSSISRKE
jgi:hypothetical protein